MNIIINRIKLILSKLWLKYKLDKSEYTLDNFLSVEPYVKNAIAFLYDNETRKYGYNRHDLNSINERLVKNIVDNDDIILPKLKRNIQIDSVVIEGNDISGKETYSKFLHEELGKIANKNIIVTETYLLSFPNYNSTLGMYISKLLRKSNKTNFDKYLLNWLFCYDRVNTMMNLYYKFNDQTSSKIKYHYILIFDRFYHSNWIYSINNNEQPIADYMFRVEAKFFESTNIRDIIVFHRSPIESDETHDNLIKNKPDKDLNETIEFQKKIRDRLLSYRFKYLATKKYMFPNKVNISYFSIKKVIIDNSPRSDEFISQLCSRLNLK